MSHPAAASLQRLSACLGARVQDVSGRGLGRITDIELAAGAGRPSVTGLHVGRRRRTTRVPWAAVRSFTPDRVIVVGAGDGPPRDPALLLGRDVLDTQVIDLDGRRVARVGDVDLSLRDGELQPVAVDVGLAPVARRLGLRRIARRLHADPIAWEGMYLASGRGHEVMLTHRAAEVHRLDHDELMTLVAGLPPQRGAELLASARPGEHPDPLAVARSAGRPRRRFRVMHKRKRAPA